MSLFERIGLLIWKMRNHDQMIQELEAELDDAQDEILRLKYKIKKLEEKLNEKDHRAVAHSLHHDGRDRVG